MTNEEIKALGLREGDIVQAMAISAMFTAMIESHEATWGKR